MRLKKACYKNILGGIKLKKVKVYALIIFAILLILISGSASAHSVNLDPNSSLSLPNAITNGSATVKIKGSTNYTLYYQWVEIESNIINQITATRSSYNSYIVTGGKELETKKETYLTLEGEYKAKSEVDMYSNDTIATYDLYELAIDAYNSYIDEYNQKIQSYENKIKNLTPSYIENNWIQSEDNKVSTDLNFKGEKVLVLWVKLVNSNGTSYDEAIYNVKGTKKEGKQVKSVELNKNTLSLTVGESEIIIADINPYDATDKTITWTSSNELVSIVQDGKITGISEGTSQIAVQSNNGEIDICEVTVTNIQENQNVNINNNTKVNNVEDNTIMQSSLPAAGLGIGIVFVIAILGIISFISYNKFIKSKF